MPDNGCEFKVDPNVIYVSGPTGTDQVGCGATPPCASINYGIGEAVSQTKASGDRVWRRLLRGRDPG